MYFYSMNEIIAIFLGTHVGAYCICPTNDHDNGRTNGKMNKIFIVRVGRNNIRPANGYTNGRMDGKIDRVSVRFYPMNQKLDRD